VGHKAIVRTIVTLAQAANPSICARKLTSAVSFRLVPAYRAPPSASTTVLSLVRDTGTTLHPPIPIVHPARLGEFHARHQVARLPSDGRGRSGRYHHTAPTSGRENSSEKPAAGERRDARLRVRRCRAERFEQAV
jgi:hypothetical protein